MDNDDFPTVLDQRDRFNPIRQNAGSEGMVLGHNRANANEAIIGAEKMDAIRRAFYDQETIERQDPRNLQIRFVHYNTSEDYATNKQIQSPRHMYVLYISKGSSVLDLKQRINREFGFAIEQIQVYFRYELIKDLVYLH
jgi:hypothetical protein